MVMRIALLVVVILLLRHVDAVKFGLSGARRSRALVPPNARGRVRKDPTSIFSRQRTVSSLLLELRGGSDRGGYGYGNYDDRGERGGYDYDGRRATNDYSRQDDGRGRTADYGYQDDGRKKPYEYGYQEDDGRATTGSQQRSGDENYIDSRSSRYDDARYTRDRDYDDDRGGQSTSSKVPSFIRTGNKQYGMMLLSAGAVSTLLGMTMFFNKTLLRLGNILFVAGVPMTLGPGRTAGYFLQPKKARATGCLAFGMFLVLVGWPIFGLVLEVFGLLNLFGNMFPLVTAMLRQMPVVGALFGSGNRGGNKSSRSSGSSQKDDRYYEDNRYYGKEQGSQEQDESAERYY